MNAPARKFLILAGLTAMDEVYLLFLPDRAKRDLILVLMGFLAIFQSIQRFRNTRLTK